MDVKVVENALDFIARGAKDFWDDRLSEEQQVKYSTIHLYEGVELLLKARLMREHWSLIVDDLDRSSKEDVEKGDFVSVNYDAARKRLNAVCGVQLDDRAKQAFNQLRQFRNRYVHFTCSDPRPSVMGAQLQAWHHALKLLESGFLGHLAPSHLTQIEAVKREMMRSEDFLNTRFQQAQNEIKEAREAGQLVARCPTCGKKSLLTGAGGAACPVCGISEEYAVAAAERYESDKVPWWDIKDGATPREAGWCEECGLHSVVEAGKDLSKQVLDRLEPVKPRRGEKVYVCFSCGEPALERARMDCASCGALFFNSGGGVEPAECPACDRLN